MKFSIFYKNIFNHVSCGQSKNNLDIYLELFLRKRIIPICNSLFSNSSLSNLFIIDFLVCFSDRLIELWLTFSSFAISTIFLSSKAYSRNLFLAIGFKSSKIQNIISTFFFCISSFSFCSFASSNFFNIVSWVLFVNKYVREI